MTAYIDDILVLAESNERAKNHVEGVGYSLQCLGFQINQKKSVLEPAQVREFLGPISGHCSHEIETSSRQNQQDLCTHAQVLENQDNRSYASPFRKWYSWCHTRSSDPFSGPVIEVVNFLANLYKEGYHYRSLNSYRSAISSVHERADGYTVGQHPLVVR